jgi:hypothetical protein
MMYNKKSKKKGRRRALVCNAFLGVAKNKKELQDLSTRPGTP